MKQFDSGKWAEEEVKKVLGERSSSDVTFAYHRYPDSRAARSALGPQPADYEVSWRPIGSFNLEVKETGNPRRLAKSKIGQFGMLKKFWWAGKPAFILIYITPLSCWYVLTPRDLFPDNDEHVTSFTFGQIEQTFNNPSAAITWILDNIRYFKAS